MLTSLFLLGACNQGNQSGSTPANDGIDSTFEYKVDRFADIEILRYPVPGFNSLSLQQKELIYYLSQAALEDATSSGTSTTVTTSPSAAFARGV